MSRKRVLFLVSSLQFGGAEIQTVNLLNRLRCDDLEIHLAHFLGGGPLQARLDPGAIAGLHDLGKRGRFDLRFLWRLAGLLTRLQPHAVVAVALYPAFLANVLRLACRLRFRMAVILHAAMACNAFEHRVNRLLYRWVADVAERTIYVCRKQMDYWAEVYGVHLRNASCIYNGVDHTFFAPRRSGEPVSPLRAELGIGPEASVICICAALRPEKRHQDLIDAFAILQRDLPNARLLILGDGPERGSVEQRIAARGLTDRVRILGFHQDVRPYLEIADLCVLSSATEAFSMAILEAMSMGKAIVGPRVGGVTEQVIDGVNGLTYPPGDVAELAAAMQSILQEGRAAAMGVCSRARVEELFTLDRMVESYDALLAAL